MDRIGYDHQSANGLFNVQRTGSVDGGANILSTKGDTNLAHRKKILKLAFIQNDLVWGLHRYPLIFCPRQVRRCEVICILLMEVISPCFHGVNLTLPLKTLEAKESGPYSIVVGIFFRVNIQFCPHLILRKILQPEVLLFSLEKGGTKNVAT